MTLQSIIERLQRIEAITGPDVQVHFRSKDDEFDIEGVEYFRQHGDETKPLLVAIFEPGAEDV